ncbi:nuclear transport factor 2 family protein [Microbacterium sp. RD1]|uniref:nuclear transport factor 2 family protein n=1 Tax=Microbacterium sp. RD1 TaxID=3457313 RepID=UPI003FA5280D
MKQFDALGEDRLQALADREEIRDVLAMYFRADDSGDWDLLRECYHEDATDEHDGAYSGSIDGLIEWCKEWVPKQFRSWLHLGAQSLIDLHGDTADVESYAVALHKTHPDARGKVFDVVAAGRFYDRFERRNGAWKIAHRKLVIDFIPDGIAASDSNPLDFDQKSA